jgi:hypothetical protein
VFWVPGLPKSIAAGAKIDSAKFGRGSDVVSMIAKNERLVEGLADASGYEEHRAVTEGVFRL